MKYYNPKFLNAKANGFDVLKNGTINRKFGLHKTDITKGQGIQITYSDNKIIIAKENP